MVEIQIESGMTEQADTTSNLLFADEITDLTTIFNEHSDGDLPPRERHACSPALRRGGGHSHGLGYTLALVQ